MMVSLIINPDSVRISESKISTQIFSEIYFQIGSVFFPEEKWDDFSVVVLGWWLQEACCIKPGRRSIFRFMDGPYYFEVCLIDDSCDIDFISDRYNKKEIVFSNRMKFKDFLGLLTKSANLVIRELPTEVNELKDVLELKNNLKLLQKYVKLLRS